MGDYSQNSPPIWYPNGNTGSGLAFQNPGMPAASGPSISNSWGMGAPDYSQPLAVNSVGMPMAAGMVEGAGTGQPPSMLDRAGGWFKNNAGTMGTVVQGIGTLAQAYLGYQQLKQAKAAFGLQKEMANANLNNSIKSYNNSLEDRIRGRTAAYAGKENDVASYLSAHSLSR